MCKLFFRMGELPLPLLLCMTLFLFSNWSVMQHSPKETPTVVWLSLERNFPVQKTNVSIRCAHHDSISQP